MTTGIMAPPALDDTIPGMPLGTLLALRAERWRRRRDRAAAWYAAKRSLFTSLSMVIFGALLAIYGGSLIGRWAEGLVILVLGGGLLWLGLAREAGDRRPLLSPVAEVLERYRRAP